MGNQVQGQYQPHQKKNSQPDLKKENIMNAQSNVVYPNNQKQVIKPINPQEHHRDSIQKNYEVQQKMFGKFVKLSEIQANFKHYANEKNVLSLDRFNECIMNILKYYDLPNLYQSYLSERLFKLMDMV